MTSHYPDLGSACDNFLVESNFPDVGSDLSSVWNFAFVSEMSFCRKSVVVSPNVGCFLRLKYLWSFAQSSDLVNFSLFTL